MEAIMDYSLFLDWLVVNKKMTQRSAKDVLSRCKRVLRIIDKDVIHKGTLEQLNASEEFNAKSVFIKSQLRRAVNLLCEYEDGNNG